MNIPVIVRGTLKGTPVFEERTSAEEIGDDDVASERHLDYLIGGKVDMLEFEFPTLPEEDRFFRFGTNPAGMVAPIAIKLGPK